MYNRGDQAVIRNQRCDKCNKPVVLSGAHNDDTCCTCYFITLDLEWMVQKDQKILDAWQKYGVTWDEDSV